MLSLNSDFQLFNSSSPLESGDSEDDLLFFEDESEVEDPKNQAETWKILIVDDDEEIHKVTQLALKNFTFEGKSLTFLNVYSGQEAKESVQNNFDIALIFLDVIMESDQAGLEVVQYIRESLNNRRVRIVLRTGQPGQVPEKSVILNYDIDDYKTKTELTGQKLFTTVVTALRTFSTLNKIEQVNESLQQEIEHRKQVEAALLVSEAKEREKATLLAQSLQDLQQVQLQLIQAEKMSVLGLLVESVIYELENPVNFIYGNLSYVSKYLHDLLNLLQLYQIQCPLPNPEIQRETEEIDLEFLQIDYPKLLSSLQVGIERIKNILQSLRNFSPIEEAEVKEVNIHLGIDSTLKLLENRLKSKLQYPEIKVIKEYGELPKIQGYGGLLNQVFMSILASRIEAINTQNYQFRPGEKIPESTIKIKTERIDNKVVIRISDNGPALPQEVQQTLFDANLISKPEIPGTPFGMPLSYAIITEKHLGSLQYISTSEHGTEFRIEIPINQDNQ